ncbi:MAG: 5,10-methylenetetrahydrofolate reductase [Euryarchaeota archaeon]|nr:5,10-methylenetetrahydrofolate reductase [Euryarchaeota archaeon]
MEPKSPEEVEEMLEGLERVAVVGCSKCAKSNQVGGPEQVEAMASRLEGMGKEVVGKAVLDGICALPNSGEGIDAIPPCHGVLVLACGAGCQAIIHRRRELRVLPGTNTLFLGIYPRKGEYLKRCALCGDCILHLTGGICPLARCPKGMVSGPCGDATGGKCGLSRSGRAGERDCVWVEIYQRRRKSGL